MMGRAHTDADAGEVGGVWGGCCCTDSNQNGIWCARLSRLHEDRRQKKNRSSFFIASNEPVMDSI